MRHDHSHRAQPSHPSHLILVPPVRRNVDALFSLHGDAVVQDATNPADFNYFYPVPLPVKKEYACPSSGMNVPTSPFNLVPSPQALPKPPLIKGIGPL